MMCFCSLIKHLYCQAHSAALDINQGFTPIYIKGVNFFSVLIIFPYHFTAFLPGAFCC